MVSKTKCLITITAILGVVVSYFSYLTLTPNPQDGILFGTVMAVIGMLAGINVKEFMKKGPE